MFSRFFIDRPIFAAVISVFLVLAGLSAMRNLPIAQYPEIAPPVVTVTATYPGASATVLEETVASPLELAPNRVRIEGIAVGQSASQRVLIRGAKPFRILGVDGIGAGVTVELPTTAGKLLPVQVITVNGVGKIHRQ